MPDASRDRKPGRRSPIIAAMEVRCIIAAVGAVGINALAASAMIGLSVTEPPRDPRARPMQVRVLPPPDATERPRPTAPEADVSTPNGRMSGSPTRPAAMAAPQEAPEPASAPPSASTGRPIPAIPTTASLRPVAPASASAPSKSASAGAQAGDRTADDRPDGPGRVPPAAALPSPAAALPSPAAALPPPAPALPPPALALAPPAAAIAPPAVTLPPPPDVAVPPRAAVPDAPGAALSQPGVPPTVVAAGTGSGSPHAAQASLVTPPSGGGAPRIGPRVDASWAGNAPPAYPASARRLGEQGEVRLDVHVGVDGAVLDVRLRASSGSPALDRSAIDAVRRWRFTPASVDGRSIAEWYRDWTWVFRLEG